MNVKLKQKLRNLVIRVLEGKLSLYEAKRLAGDDVIEFVREYNKYASVIEPLKDISRDIPEVQELVEIGCNLIKSLNNTLGYKAFDFNKFNNTTKIYSKYLNLLEGNTNKLKKEILLNAMSASANTLEIKQKMKAIRLSNILADIVENEHTIDINNISPVATPDMMVEGE